VPTDADAYSNRANIHSHARLKLPAFFTRSEDIGNYGYVMKDYDKAIELAPDRPMFYANRAGLMLEKLQQIRALEAKVISNPSLPEMFKKDAKTEVAKAQGLEKSLLDDISKAIELDGNNVAYWANRGFFKMMMLNNIEGGVADFTRALAIDPKLLNALIFRCNGYSKLGRYPEAIQDATLAISLQPQNLDLYFNRGVAYRMSGDYNAAIKDFDEVIKRDPKNVKAYANRAEAHTAIGNKKEAIADWETYLSLGGGRMFRDEAAVNEKIKKLRPRWPFGR
jgi:tetratricopeptide (TPR) repeat protein